MGAQTIDRLSERVRGEVIAPDDEGYDEARKVYNAMIDRRPAVVVRCTSTDDVIAAVNFARENELPVAVRGGGHSVPGFGTGDDAVVVDLTGMTDVQVDPEAQTARAEGGATWGDFNDATHAHGLATTGGIISTTGVGGLTLGGGIGYLARGFGLSCDNLISAEVVTADGQHVTASEAENDDLFWALRGGGGNFGVVTSFEFRLHPVKDDLRRSDVLRDRRCRRPCCASTASSSSTRRRSSVGSRPGRSRRRCRSSRRTATASRSSRSSPAGRDRSRRARRRSSRCREVAPIVAEHVGPMPYPALNSAFDGLVPAGLQHYWKANFVKELTDDAIDAHLEHGPKVPVVNSTVHIYPINGAVNRVPSDATAFAYRDATFATVIAGMWPDAADNEANIKWVRDYYDATAPLLGGGRLRQLHGRRRPGAHQGQLQGQLRPTRRRQAEVRPRQPLPLQPEHQAVAPRGV